MPNWELQTADASVILLLMENLFERCEAASNHLYGKEQLHHSFTIFLYEVAAQSAKYTQTAINKLTRKGDLEVRFADPVSKHVRKHRKVQFMRVY
jgi:AraC family transcriptional regulator, transcriptional activator of pobA